MSEENLKKKPGRPRSKEPYTMISFTISEDLFLEITRRACREGCSHSSIVTQSVRRYFAVENDFGDGETSNKSQSLTRKLYAISDILAQKEENKNED